MRYIAKTSFAGPVTMYKGEERQLTKKEAAPLLKCGYIVAASEKEEPEQQAENTAE